jgi:hypothetical protein
MTERREKIIFHGNKEMNVHTDVVDDITWWMAYNQGLRPARYPVPAHAYITMIAPHSVEMITGIVKTYYEDVKVKGWHEPYIAFDCECVFYATNYPSRTKV